MFSLNSLGPLHRCTLHPWAAFLGLCPACLCGLRSPSGPWLPQLRGKPATTPGSQTPTQSQVLKGTAVLILSDLILSPAPGSCLKKRIPLINELVKYAERTPLFSSHDLGIFLEPQR